MKFVVYRGKYYKNLNIGYEGNFLNSINSDLFLNCICFLLSEKYTNYGIGMKGCDFIKLGLQDTSLIKVHF